MEKTPETLLGENWRESSHLMRAKRSDGQFKKKKFYFIFLTSIQSNKLLLWGYDINFEICYLNTVNKTLNSPRGVQVKELATKLILPPCKKAWDPDATLVAAPVEFLLSHEDLSWVPNKTKFQWTPL